MQKQQIATYMLYDGFDYAAKTIKKTSIFSLKLVSSLLVVSALTLGIDYGINHKIYDSHFDLSLQNQSPFAAFTSTYYSDLETNSQYQYDTFFTFQKEWKASQGHDNELQENLVSLKKLIASNNNNADNPFILNFQDFTVALAIKLLHRNPAFDNNTEFNTIKHNLMVSAQDHYLKTKPLTQAKSNEITNFCQTGIIGRVSCIEQDAQFHLDLNKIDTLNGQTYYDLESASSNYTSFLKVMNETPQFIRAQHEQQLSTAKKVSM